MRIVVSNMPFMESVTIGIFVRVGGRYEDRHSCGMSHIIEHLLFKGTLTRTALQLKETIEGVGGSFNGFTGEECTCLLTKIPAKHVDLGFEILSDMIANPKMEPAEIEKEKMVILEEIKMYKDQPAQYVQELLAEAMWPNHPLGMPLAGYEKTVRSFDRKKIANFKDRFYRPHNMAVVACGRLNEDKFRKQVKSVFFKSRGKNTGKFLKFNNRQRSLRLRLLNQNTQQTQLAFGFHSFKRSHPDRYSRALLNVILGASMSSRLFEELREKRGLCYDIGTGAKGYIDTGAFLIHAGVDNKKVKEAIDAIIDQLVKIKAEAVGNGELERSKEFLKGQLALLLEDTASRMLWLGERVISNERVPKTSEVLKRIDEVRTPDVRRVAGETFVRKNLNLACIGPTTAVVKKRIKRMLGAL